MKLSNIDQLRKIIVAETKRVLSEIDLREEVHGEDSLDAQVDKYLVDYESESKLSKNESKDFRALVRRFLQEAETEEKDAKGKKAEKKLLSSEDIDVDNFVESVVRLIDNYDNLLEVRNTILRRTFSFLEKSYEREVVDSFKEALKDRYDIEVGKSKSESSDEDFQPPPAERAGASLGG